MRESEQIQITELSFGKALAYLAAHQNGSTSADISNLSDEELRIFEMLRERLNTLKASRYLDVSQSLPAGPCILDGPYLEDNRDIFVEMVLLAADNHDLKEECNRIWKHLNDCYRCFDYFCRVMRGYSLTTLEFIKMENHNGK